MLFVSKTCLEAYAEADSGEVAINQSVVLAIKEVGVTDAGVVLVGVVRVQADTDRLGGFHEVGAVAFDVMGPGDVRAQVDTGDHVAVIQGRTQAIAPGEVGEEAVVFSPATRTGRLTCSTQVGRANTICIRRLAKQRVSSELGGAVTSTQPTDVVGSHFTNQRQATGTQNTVDKVNRTDRGLPELLPLIAPNLGTWRSTSIITVGIVIISVSFHYSRQSCPTHITAVNSQRHIGTIAQLTRDRGASNIGTKTNTVQADIFRVIKEITGRTPSTVQPDYMIRRSQATLDIRIDRGATMVVHGEQAKLSVIQRWNKPTQSDTKLATVTCLLVLPGPHYVLRSSQRRSVERHLIHWQVYANPAQAVVATPAHYVCRREEGTAVIRDSAAPLQLIESLHGQVFRQALGEV